MNMEVRVLSVRTVGKGLRIAHVRFGDLVGDCPAAPDVVEGGIGYLSVKPQVREGRLGATVRVNGTKGDKE